MRLNNLLPHRIFRVHLKSFEVDFNSRPRAYFYCSLYLGLHINQICRPTYSLLTATYMWYNLGWCQLIECLAVVWVLLTAHFSALQSLYKLRRIIPWRACQQTSTRLLCRSTRMCRLMHFEFFRLVFTGPTCISVGNCNFLFGTILLYYERTFSNILQTYSFKCKLCWKRVAATWHVSTSQNQISMICSSGAALIKVTFRTSRQKQGNILKLL